MIPVIIQASFVNFYCQASQTVDLYILKGLDLSFQPEVGDYTVLDTDRCSRRCIYSTEVYLKVVSADKPPCSQKLAANIRKEPHADDSHLSDPACLWTQKLTRLPLTTSHCHTNHFQAFYLPNL